jgi:hypothetical protein
MSSPHHSDRYNGKMKLLMSKQEARKVTIIEELLAGLPERNRRKGAGACGVGMLRCIV